MTGATYTEQFKLECLARHLLRAMTLEDRRKFLAEYKGDRKVLETELIKQHNEGKKNERNDAMRTLA